MYQIKIKLVNIYMKDEHKVPLGRGNYIVYLQNHNESRSHWVCFFKR